MLWSKRSGHGNAYFTGIGGVKRIVFFDTLIDKLSTKEVVAVLAHEIGHEKKGHIKRTLLISIVSTFVMFWILSLLLSYAPLYQAFGIDTPSNHSALIVFSVISGPVGFFLSPFLSILSRIHEYEADTFAVMAVGNNQDLAEALLKLSKDNLSNPVPHPWYSFFHYSHPTLAERLAAMEKLSPQTSAS